MQAVKQKTIVGKDGEIKLNTSQIPEGTAIEVIILVDSIPEDTTEYLLSTKANQKELSEAIIRVKNKEDLVIISEADWYENTILFIKNS
jgi:antitoxin YefM